MKITRQIVPAVIIVAALATAGCSMTSSLPVAGTFAVADVERTEPAGSAVTSVKTRTDVDVQPVREVPRSKPIGTAVRDLGPCPDNSWDDAYRIVGTRVEDESPAVRSVVPYAGDKTPAYREVPRD